MLSVLLSKKNDRKLPQHFKNIDFMLKIAGLFSTHDWVKSYIFKGNLTQWEGMSILNLTI